MLEYQHNPLDSGRASPIDLGRQDGGHANTKQAAAVAAVLNCRAWR